MYTTPRCNKCDRDISFDVKVIDSGKLWCEKCNQDRDKTPQEG